MLRLLRLVHLPFWRQHPWQALLPAMGIAIGVAAVLAVDLGTRSTVDTFQDTLSQLEGRATQVVRPGSVPLDPRLATELAGIRGVGAAAPVLECIGLHEEPLRIYGIDPLAENGIRALSIDDLDGGNSRHGFSELSARLLSEPGTVLLSTPYMQRRRVAVGDTLHIAVGSQKRQIVVLGALPREVAGMKVPDNLAICDLATAQELSGRRDVDRIDLMITGLPRRPILHEIRTRLGEARLTAPGGRRAQLERILGPLQMNLRALSYLALFVSLFLIYNSMVIAVLRRRPTIGIVRCLGASPRSVLGAWLLEALAVGAIGTAAGLILGLVGGRVALGGIARTASDLYGWVQGARFHIDAEPLARASAVGIVATLLAALAPALEAAGTPPLRATMRSEVEINVAARVWRRALLASAPLLAMTIVLLSWPTSSPWPGYAAAVSVALLAAALAPPLGSRLLVRAAPLLQRLGGVVTALAARNIEQSLSRTGIAVAALTVALSMSIGMGTMVSSFRAELTRWIEGVVRADVYISPATAEVDRENAELDEGLVRQLEQSPQVEAVDTYRAIRVRRGRSETICAGIEIATYRRYSQTETLDGTSSRDFFDRLEQGQAGVSEALARKWKLRKGDRFEVMHRGDRVELRVAAVYRDYSSDQGVLLLDLSTFSRHFGERAPQGAALYTVAGTDSEQLVAELKSTVGSQFAVLIRSNRSLRERAYTIFERTFRVARGLEIVGIAVAAIGILAALLALLLERGRELATLRSIGLEPARLRQLLLSESLLIAALAWIFALACGSALAWILLHVINLRSFGWLLPFHVPWTDWLLTLGWSLLAAVAATWIPLRHSERLSISRALREE